MEMVPFLEEMPVYLQTPSSSRAEWYEKRIHLGWNLRCILQ
jgi:hypothetical protein